MAAADTARLVASLTLDAKGFTKGLSAADKQLGKMESTAFRVGQNIGSGLKTGLDNLAKLGVVAAGGIALAVKSGLDDLAELENAVTSVDGAIAQLGLTGQITGKQVADWANQIEADVDAAFDDKAITQAATTLIRFGRVTPKNLRQTLEVMTDLAAKTGDVESASTLLAKALADPATAAGKLTRQGIILTQQQKDQIKAMTEAGDVAGAQAVVLDAVATATTGAAKAMAGPYQDAINKTNDAIEDGKKALAIGFLPVITKVADKLSKIVADPKALASIKAFGESLAGGLDKLISTAERLPWDAIGKSLQLAGTGAKAVLDAFTSLPPWIQTAVLTGWGLNKLTGGALSGIVGELGKGLIKGVLGINAGVVNIKAGTVVGGGGAPVGGGGTGTLGKVAAVTTAATGAVVIATVEEIGAGAQADFAAAIGGSPTFVEMARQLQVGPLNITGALDRVQRALSGDFRSELEVQQGLQTKGNATMSSTLAKLGENTQATLRSNERLESIRMQQAAGNAAAIRDSQSERAAIAIASREQQAAQARTAEAARAAAAAIRDKDLSVQTTVNVQQRVSVNGLTKAVETYNRLYRTAS